MVDGRALAAIDEDAWQLLEEEVAKVRPRAGGLFERQAVVVGPGVRGARTAALLPALGPGDSFRLFTDPNEAYRWVDPTDGPGAQALVDELVASIAMGSIEVAVRTWIGDHLRSGDLERCARALGLSSRSLQRKLGAAGLSFRSLLAEERSRAARALLLAGDAKVESVARAVGCSSSSQLGVLLRRAGLPAPSAMRARKV